MHRMLLEKNDRAVWMSHLDFMRLMQRAFRRAGVLLHHSQGFTPHAYVSMLLPLSVGTESECEIMEYELDGALQPTCESMNAVLPEGVRVLSIYESGRKAKELTRLRVRLTLEYDRGAPPITPLATLLSEPTLVVEKRTKRGMEETDIRPALYGCEITSKADRIDLLCTVSAQNPALNPMLLVSAIERYLPQYAPDGVKCRRLETLADDGTVFR